MNSNRKILTLFLLLSTYLSFSQDIITMKSGEDIEAKVLEITVTEVKYKKFDFQDGPTYTILKSNTLMIRYKNGSKDIFPEPVVVPKEDSTSNAVTDRRKTYDSRGLPTLRGKNWNPSNADGMLDARLYYDGKKSGAGWTVATVFVVSPLIGLIPALSCGATPPEDYNLNIPDRELMRDDTYADDYRREAHKIKKKKIWKSYCISSIVYSLATIVYLSN